MVAGWNEEVRTLRAKAPEERDRKRAGAMQLRVAQLYYAFDDGPSRDARVEEALTKCALLYPAMPQLREFIERGAEAKGDFAHLAQQLEKLTKETQDRLAQAELWVRVGRVKLAPLNDRAAALAAFTKAAQLDPTRPDGVSLAAELLIDDGKVAEAAQLWEAHLAALPAARRSGTVRLLLAGLYAKSLNEPEKARAQVLEALRSDPRSRPTWRPSSRSSPTASPRSSAALGAHRGHAGHARGAGGAVGAARVAARAGGRAARRGGAAPRARAGAGAW